ncbi:MAG: hypothetical protein ACREAK_10340 [Nitrosarchaeum sp.]
MSERIIDNIKVGIYNSRLSSLRFSVRGGSTGEHFVQYLQGEWRCNCHGFMSHAKCRHVKSGNVLLRHIEQALDEIEQGEKENWKSSQV